MGLQQGLRFHPIILVARVKIHPMTPSSTRWRDSLERWSPTLFLLAGAVLVILLAIGQTVRFTTMSIPRTAYWPLFPLTFGLSLVGLLGLAPRMAERKRWSALVGAGFGVVGATMLFTGLGVLIVASPPGPYPGNLGVLGAPFFLGLLAFVPAAMIYGVLGLRTGIPSRRIGALLLLVGLLQFGELLGAEVVFSSAGTAAPNGSYILFEIIVFGVIATALTVVGYSLRRGVARTGIDSTVTSPDAPAEVS